VHFTLEQRFAGALEQVQDALVEPDLLARYAELPKLGRPELLTHDDNGDCVRQRVRYSFTGDLSPAVTAVIDRSKLTWVEESVLDRRTHRTTFTIEPDHYADRLRCHGVFRLAPDGDERTTRFTEGEITVRFPLLGSRVELAIVSGLAEHAAAEVTVVDAWLADRSGR
jgi:hypothetical protein